jgi:UDP-N-acetylmuramoyl-L-alanyl-D-glutamate--2,6-diaminopimelate ligase
VDALLRAHGLRTGIIGTIQYVVGAETRPANQTTPEALEIEAMLAEMRAAGVGGVAMEVSSHALALSRVDELQFDVAVFTNLTQDHLDFHGSLEEYRNAKRRLFELLAASPKPRRTAVVNADDPAWRGDGPRPRSRRAGLRTRRQLRRCGRSSTARRSTASA